MTSIVTTEVTADEVLELLRRVGRREVVPRMVADLRPTGCEALFDVEGWQLRVGFDLDDECEFNYFYYIAWTVAPDGRRGGFIHPPELFCGEDGELAEAVASAFEGMAE